MESPQTDTPEVGAERRERNRPILAISIGDVNGIGPEVVIKTFADTRMMHYCTPVIFASASVLNFHRKPLDIKTFNYSIIESPDEIQAGKVNVVNSLPEVRINYGERSAETGKAAIISLEAATDAVLAGHCHALVTAPIDKSTTSGDSFPYAGHTDYLRHRAEAEMALMMLTGESMRVGLVTAHVPLKDVSARLTQELIVAKAEIMYRSLIADFGLQKPRIAILGLNPHAGDNGLMGAEEMEVIIPAIDQLKAMDILVSGPYPADGFFGARMYSRFDGVLAMYHDQGLVPFKLLDFESGINFTAGLNFVRTSPDHGTGFAIAGKNQANESSFRHAVLSATDILQNRADWAEMSGNPLQQRLIRRRER